eukprot:s1501_g11.t1
MRAPETLPVQATAEAGFGAAALFAGGYVFRFRISLEEAQDAGPCFGANMHRNMQKRIIAVWDLASLPHVLGGQGCGILLHGWNRPEKEVLGNDMRRTRCRGQSLRSDRICCSVVTALMTTKQENVVLAGVAMVVADSLSRFDPPPNPLDLSFQLQIDWRALEGIPDSKIKAILSQLGSLVSRRAVGLKDLQSVIGRLLWLTAAWHHLRPLLIPLYRALRSIPVTMVGVNQLVFQQVVDLVDENLCLSKSLTSLHHSLAQVAHIKRVANTFVSDRESLQSVHVKSRRVWLYLTDPCHRIDFLKMMPLQPSEPGMKSCHLPPFVSQC